MKVREVKELNLEGGYLIDGFPSIGYTSAISTESMIQTSQFELAGVITSDSFPAMSIIKEGKPNFPTRIFVNEDLKVAVFSSYLTLHESLHRTMAKQMLDWAKKHKCSLVVSSVAVKTTRDEKQEVAAGSTDSAKKKLKDAGFSVLQHGTIPGIPGALLNEGMLNNQDVAVILFNAKDTGPDFKASVELCMAMAKLVPGVSCNIESLQKDAETAEKEIKETDQETRNLTDSMYR